MLNRSLISLALLFAAAPLAAQTPITLDQAMAHPDWIGTPVESAWWSGDSQQVFFRQKLNDSPVRGVYAYDRRNGSTVRVEGNGWSAMDEAAQDIDKSRQRLLFIRQGDVFLRNLANNGLTQITKSPEAETGAQFSADGNRVFFRRGNDWYAWQNSGLIEPVLLLKADTDPNKITAPSAATAHELRLIATLARQKAERDALKADAEARKAADASTAIAATYLGKTVDISSSSLSPDGRYALVITTEKGANEGQTGKMPKYVTESGFEEFEETRTRVGRNMPLPQKLWLVDVRTQSVRALDFSVLPGIAVDPLSDLRKAQKLEPLSGNRGVRMEYGTRWSADGSQVAVMVRSIDNKDRWLAGVDFAKADETCNLFYFWLNFFSWSFSRSPRHPCTGTLGTPSQAW